MGFDAVDQSEVTIMIGETETCIIISYTSTAISCVPPQSEAGIGALDIVVSSQLSSYAFYMFNFIDNRSLLVKILIIILEV